MNTHSPAPPTAARRPRRLRALLSAAALAVCGVAGAYQIVGDTSPTATTWSGTLGTYQTGSTAYVGGNAAATFRSGLTVSTVVSRDSVNNQNSVYVQDGAGAVKGFMNARAGTFTGFSPSFTTSAVEGVALLTRDSRVDGSFMNVVVTNKANTSQTQTIQVYNDPGCHPTSSAVDSTATCARGLMTITFNRPVTNPVLHLAGLGGNTSILVNSVVTDAWGVATNYRLTNPGATMTLLGTPVNLAVTTVGGQPRIGVAAFRSGANFIQGSCTPASGLAAGCGSVQVNGTYTQLNFEVSLTSVRVVTTETTKTYPLPDYDTAQAANSTRAYGPAADATTIAVSVSEDFGDAPASFDPTAAASHVIGDLKLGSTVDADNIGTLNGGTAITPSPSAVAAGADNTGTSGDGADEDAITTFPALVTTATTYSLNVPISGASAAGQVCGWIDLDRSNVFGNVASERACAAFAAGASSVTLNWSGLSGLTTGTNYVRLRASYNTTGVQSPTGRLDSGEVEDYRLTITPAADLAITKTGPSSVMVGDTATYTLKVWNQGPTSVTGATIADSVPANLTNVTWTCAASGTATCGTASGSGNGISFASGTLPVNTTTGAAGATNAAPTTGSYLTITVTGTASSTGSFTNTATVSAPAGTTDVYAANSSASQATTVTPPFVSTTPPVCSALTGNTGLGANLVTDFSGGTFGVSSGDPTEATTGTKSPTAWPYAASTIPNYTYIQVSTTSPNDGFLSLVNRTSTPRIFNVWSSSLTPITVNGSGVAADDSATGRFLLVNGANPGNPVLVSTVTGLTPHTNYQVSGVFANLFDGGATGALLPNVDIYINNVVYYKTGNIPQDQAAKWRRSGFVFNSGTSTTVTFKLVNNVTSGNGNDFAFDGLDFSECQGTWVNTVSGFLYGDMNASSTFQNPAEPQLPAGVTVDLRYTDPSGNPVTVAKTTTGVGADTGKYVFTNVPPPPTGFTYYVHVEDGSLAGEANTVPAGYTLTTANNAALPGTPNYTSGTNAGPDFGFRSTADLSITKTDGVGSVNAGSTTTYTVRVSNAGPNATTGTLTDAAVAGLNVTAVACSGTPGVCTAGTTPTVAQLQAGYALPILAAGQFYELTVTGTVTAPSGTIANTATVAVPGGTTDSASGNNTVTDTDTVTPVADLTLTKTNGTSSVTAGGTTTYTITLTNTGPSTANNTVLTDPAVTGLSKTGASCVAAGGAACPAITTSALESGVTIATLPAGGSVTLTVTANVTATGGSVTNSVTATLPGGTVDPTPTGTVSDTDTVTPVADLAVTKTDGVGSVNAGSATTYTVRVTNAGPSSVTGAVLTDAAVAGLNVTAVACSGTPGVCTAGTTPTVAQLQAGYALPTLAGGQFYELTVTATVTATSGTVANTATIAAPGGTTDPASGNNAATDTDTVTPVTDLSITKTDGVSTFRAGGVLTYTVVVGNAGPSSAVGATVSDPLPAGIPAANMTYRAVVGGGATTTVSGTQSGALSDTVTVPVGGSVTYTVTVTVPTSYPTGTLTNTASVAAPAGAVDPSAANNTATDTDTREPPTANADSAGTTSPVPVTFSVTANDSGPVDPATVDLDPATPGQQTTFTDSGKGTYTVDGSGNVTFTPLATFVLGTSTISYTVQDALGVSSNAATISVSVPAAADLALSKSAPAYARPGTDVTYTLTVSNTTAATAAGYTVTDTLPGGVTFVSASDGGTYDGASRTVTWALSSLLGSAQQVLTVVVTAPDALQVESGTTTVVNSATVTLVGDPVAGNNTGSATTRMIHSDLAKRVRNVTENTVFGTSGGGKPGQVLEYCLDTRNLGGVDLGSPTGYMVRDALPANVAGLLTGYDADEPGAATGYGVRVTRGAAAPTYLQSDVAVLTETSLDVNLGVLAAGESVSVCFQATIR